MRTLMELGSNRMFHERYSNLNKNSLQSSSKNHHKQRRRHEWKQSCCKQESCLPQGTLIDIEIATDGSKILNDYHFQWENYSLLAIYSTNIKHLNNDFYFNQLQSPWNDLDAKLYLHFNYHQHNHQHHHE
ncbi:hypothetical protein DERP_007853 [Dermatophagoides pteronyssinus]|uniref:Uncharacterized protein n=1 Tax=Dermatophagoides pteronyssinus TaxID=6956 RepID=A0ABQ8ISS4_DERPT|nr:hypothetical protein DERP_007853 [Dermatophagoides pteronyssinus]